MADWNPGLDLVTITIKEDLKWWKQQYSVIADKIPAIMARSINRALDSVVTLGNKMSQEKYTIKNASLRKENVRRYKAFPSVFRARGAVVFSGGRGARLHKYTDVYPRGLVSFRGMQPRDRKPKAGVTAMLKRGGTRRPRTGPEGEKSFWARSSINGQVMIFYRPKNWRKEVAQWFADRGSIYRASKRGRKNKLEKYKYKKQTKSPLQPLYGPSPIQALLGDDAYSALEDRATDVFTERVDHEISRELMRLGK